MQSILPTRCGRSWSGHELLGKSRRTPSQYLLQAARHELRQAVKGTVFRLVQQSQEILSAQSPAQQAREEQAKEEID